MEFLFAKVMLWAQAEGYLWFNLGMAPLAGLEGRAFAPFWQRVGAFTYRHGEHFYNFQGVRSYKQQFDPQWEARYLVVPGGLVLPRVLASVGALVSGGLRGLVAR
jgi:phosphatidylglycerol lysyltransferase